MLAVMCRSCYYLPMPTKTKTRKRTELRPTTIKRYPTAAAGSVMIEMGKTKVLCTASISASPPKWLPKDDEGNYVSGWVTAEYNMMPGSTPDRKRRGPDSRGTEIQRLIGRVLRAAVDMDKMPGVAITYPLTAPYGFGEGAGGPSHYLDVPWLLVLGVVVGLPLLTSAVVGLTARSRLPLVARLE